MIQNRVLSVQGGRPAMEDAAWLDGQTRMVVCDGMGGEEAGDVASAAVLEVAKAGDFESIKANAAHAISRATHLRAGTTCTVAVLDGQTLRWLHAGDSALWLVTHQDGQSVIRRLTADQSFWGAMFLAGEDPEKISRSRKHQLLSCVMPGMDITWDEGAVDLPTAGRVWLFGSTDGFHEAFEDQRRVVDQDRLLAGLRKIVTSTWEDAETLMQGYAAETKDNATLAIWRVR